MEDIDSSWKQNQNQKQDKGGEGQGPGLQRRLGEQSLMALGATCEDTIDKGWAG